MVTELRRRCSASFDRCRRAAARVNLRRHPPSLPRARRGPARTRTPRAGWHGHGAGRGTFGYGDHGAAGPVDEPELLPMAYSNEGGI